MKSITQVVESLIKPYIDSHDRAAEAIIAPVETDATSASDDYTVGKQLILDNVLYDVIAPITTGDALVVNTNIKASDNVSSDIEALTNNVNVLIENGAVNYNINRIVSQTKSGITFTVNSDDSITLLNTATADIFRSAVSVPSNANGVKQKLPKGTWKYSLSDSAISGITLIIKRADTSIDIGRTTEKALIFTLAEDTEVLVDWKIDVGTAFATAKTLYPQIVPVSYNGPYVPYAKTNRELTAENQTLTNKVTEESAIRDVLGAKNIFPNKLVSGESFGVTFVNNGNGTITANGTFTEVNATLLSNGWSDTDLSWITPFIGKKIRVKCGVVGIDFAIRFYDSDNTNIGQIESGYNGTWGEDTVPSGIHHYAAYLFPSGTITLTDALIFPRADYEPYAMTNQELTDAVNVRVLAESTANTTHKSQLNELYAVFATLTDNQKRNCYILKNNNSKYHYASADRFVDMVVDSTNRVATISSLYLQQSSSSFTEVAAWADSNPRNTFSDQTDNTYSGTYKLCIVGIA